MKYRSNLSLSLALIIGAIASNVPIAIAAPDDVKSQDTPPSQATPQADPRLDELNYFVGEWQCEEQDVESGEGQTLQSPFLWTTVRELNDLWFFASTARGGIAEVEILGYNTLTEKFGRTIVGDGGKFANFLSNGWEDETLTWEGRVSNMTTKQMAQHQIVVIKTGDMAFKEVEQISQEDGSWMPVSEKICSKPQAR